MGKKTKVKRLVRKFLLSLLFLMSLSQSVQASEVWCWGRNYYGQLGDGTTINRYTPVQVQNLSGVVQVATGYLHTCALKQDSTIWCWGRNFEGQLGDGTTTSRLTPVRVNNLLGVVQITAGTSHTCALKNNGTIWCWGGNYYGQLGDGTTIQRPTPVQVQNLSGATQVTTGHSYTCTLKQDGTVWCWGDNGYGQLGDGTTTRRLTPVQVSGLMANLIFDHRSFGGHHSCAIVNLSQVILSPEFISFTKPGETRTVTVDVSGTTITSVTSSDPKVFQIKNNTCVNSSQDCSFDVVFKPEQLVDYTGTITVNYSGDSKTVSLQALLSRSASTPIACSKPPAPFQQVERKPKTAFVIITQVGECK